MHWGVLRWLVTYASVREFMGHPCWELAAEGSQEIQTGLVDRESRDKQDRSEATLLAGRGPVLDGVALGRAAPGDPAVRVRRYYELLALIHAFLDYLLNGPCVVLPCETCPPERGQPGDVGLVSLRFEGELEDLEVNWRVPCAGYEDNTGLRIVRYADRHVRWYLIWHCGNRECV